MNKKFDDILSKAVNPSIYPDPQDLLNTDHGYLTDENAIELVNHRLSERLKHESYVTLLDNGEIWQFNPDGTSFMVMDKNGDEIE